MPKPSKKEAPPPPPGRSLFSWILLFNALVGVIAAGGWFLYQNQHLLAQLPTTTVPNTHPWSAELGRYESESNEAALAWIKRSKLQYNDDPFLLCKEAHIFARQGDYLSFAQSLKESWSVAQSVGKGRVEVGQEIIRLARRVYTQQPDALAGPAMAQLLQDVGHQVNSPQGLHLASESWSQIHDWIGCEAAAREGLALLESSPTSSRSLPARLYTRLLTSLLEQQKDDDALHTIRALYDQSPSWLTNNWQMLEIYGEILLRTSHTVNQMELAAYGLRTELSKANGKLKSSDLPAKAAAFHALAQLYERMDKYQVARDIMHAQWVEFWDVETQTGHWNDKGYLPRFMANMTAEELASPLPVSELSAEELKRRFHTNLKVLSGQASVSRKVDQPLASHPLTGYTLNDVQVQSSSGDPRVILVGSDNRLHGFANMLSSKPPYGLLPMYVTSFDINCNWKVLT